MNLYLATPTTVFTYMDSAAAVTDNFILETYHAIKTAKDLGWIKQCGKFMLDSGAYTFMKMEGEDLHNLKAIDWEKYIYDYAVFIKTYNIEHFFELDIDKIIGYDRVKQLTNKLNILAGKPCIPVWHRSRGIDAWYHAMEQYKYVSLSASGNNKSSEWTRTPRGVDLMRKLNFEALKRGVKVHALGYTDYEVLKTIPFHSVDSSTWVRGYFGHIFYFQPDGSMKQVHRKENQRGKIDSVHPHNWKEWVKLQKWVAANI
jgi:hypothetical protein